MNRHGKPLAVVVGSGASGGMAARLLAKSGRYQVVILEKGRSLFAGLGGPAAAVTSNWANDEIAHETRQGIEDQDTILEPRSFRTQGSGLDREFVGDVNTLPTTVGGGTTHYDAKARRLREVDFITNSLMRGYESPSADPSPDTSAVPGANYANWPMQYKHLEAFFAVAEEVVGVQGPASGSPGNVENPNTQESWRSTPFPVPPGVGQLNSLLPAYAGVALGYTKEPVPVPTAIVSRPYRDGRPACVDCAFCLDFGCPINAKSGGVWQVNEAIAAGAQLVPNANVTGFDVAPSSRSSGLQRITAVHFVWTSFSTPGSATGYYGPGIVTPAEGDNTITGVALLILANTPIEATRLSLLSGVSPGTAREPSGQLGRNLMFHLQTTAIAVVNRNIHSWRGRTSTHTLDAFAGAGPSAPDFMARHGEEVPRAGIMEMGGNLNPIQAATEVAAFLYGKRIEAYMELGPFSKRLVSFTVQGEDMPQLANVVDLDPAIVDVYGLHVPRITYANHPYELAASAYYTPKMLELLDAIGSPTGSQTSPLPTSYLGIHPVFAAAINTTLPVFPTGPLGVDSAMFQAAGMTPSRNATPFNNIPASRHIMGTHRMAFDADHGPCDPFGRYWMFDNLFHAGGGLFVTAAGFNVTLTMWALSYWQAASIISGVSDPRKGEYRSYLSDEGMDVASDKLRRVIAACDGDTMIGGLIKSGGYAEVLRSHA